MFHRWLDGRRGLLLSPSDPSDLWTIRRIISKGDEVEARSTREVKQEGEYVRPGNTKRVKIRIRLRVEEVAFDQELGRLRVRGPILETDNEMVTRGEYHSLEISPGVEFSLWKERFPPWVGAVVSKESKRSPIIVVAIDTREAGVGVLSGLTMTYSGTVRSDSSGKQYAQDNAKHLRQFLSHTSELITSTVGRFPSAKIAVMGPGQTKNLLANSLSKSAKVSVVEGFDLAGEDGVRLALNNTRFSELVSGSEYSEVHQMIEEAKVRLARDDGRLAMGYASCREAVQAGAVEALIISDELFKSASEQDLVDLVNGSEASGARVILLDSSTTLGVQVSHMGGAIGLLRYALFRDR